MSNYHKTFRFLFNYTLINKSSSFHQTDNCTIHIFCIVHFYQKMEVWDKLRRFHTFRHISKMRQLSPFTRCITELQINKQKILFTYPIQTQRNTRNRTWCQKFEIKASAKTGLHSTSKLPRKPQNNG